MPTYERIKIEDIVKNGKMKFYFLIKKYSEIDSQFQTKLQTKNFFFTYMDKY